MVDQSFICFQICDFVWVNVQNMIMYMYFMKRHQKRQNNHIYGRYINIFSHVYLESDESI